MKFSPHSFKGAWRVCAALLLLASQAALAQVDTYSFAASNRTYVPLTGGTNVTYPSANLDDNISPAIAIGFPFIFDGTSYASVYASTNGFLSFNSAAGSGLNNNLDTGGATERPLVAPIWDDLGGQVTAAGSQSRYATTGTSPNRVFTFEWFQWAWNYQASGAVISFQAKLYEGSNQVEFCYQPETTATNNASASIGLAGVGMGGGSFLSLSDSGPSPSASSVTENDMIATKPVSGQVYRFTPSVPSACPTPRNVTATVSGVTATVRWTVVSGGGTFNVIYGPAGFNPATGGTTIAATGTTATIPNLIPGNYQFYVQQVCGGAAGSSALSNAGAFVVPCPSPSGLTAGTTTNTTAALTWAASLTPGATFTVYYGPSGFSAPGGTAVSGLTGTGTTLTGLSPSTTYDAYLQLVCVGGGTGAALAGPVTFTTPLTVPGNDEPCGALALGSGPRTGSNVGATTSGQNGISLPACSPAQAPKDVWFSATTSTGAVVSNLTITLTGSAAGMVRLFTSVDCANGPFTQVDCASAGGNGIGFNVPISFTGLVPGQRYYLAVSGYGSSDVSGSFTVQATPLATRVQAESPALLVYPNPSGTGQLALRLDAGHATGQATLLNALGQPVRRLALAAGVVEQHLTTTGLAAGVYTLRVSMGYEVLTRKVVLQ